MRTRCLNVGSDSSACRRSTYESSLGILHPEKMGAISAVPEMAVEVPDLA